MHEVVPKLIWIGNAKDADDTANILSFGISAIVGVAIEELPPRLTRELVFCRFPLIDGAENRPVLLRSAVSAVSVFIQEKIPVFVYCGAGMSRSLVITAAAFATVEEITPDESLRKLFSELPHDVSPQLWNDLKEACFG